MCVNVTRYKAFRVGLIISYTVENTLWTTIPIEKENTTTEPVMIKEIPATYYQLPSQGRSPPTLSWKSCRLSCPALLECNNIQIWSLVCGCILPNLVFFYLSTYQFY